MTFFKIIPILLFSSFSFGQLLTWETAMFDLVDTHLTVPGDVVSNVYGNNSTLVNIGAFSFNGNELLLDQGVILTTGTIYGQNGPVGPNNSGGSGVDNSLQGNALFSQYAGGPSYNVTILEYDIVPVDFEMNFELVFGSEEYTEYLGRGAVDAAFIIVNGAGLPLDQNYALTPGGNIICPNSICENGFNVDGNFVVESEPYYYVSNNSNTGLIQYDGLTRPLRASVPVFPGNTYHVKIMIGDVNDAEWDSGLFIRRCMSNCLATTEEIQVDYSFSIFPNPSTGNVTLEFNKALNDGVEVSVITLDGHVLQEGMITSGSTKKEFNNLPSGVYFICLKTSDAIYTEKLVVN